MSQGRHDRETTACVVGPSVDSLPERRVRKKDLTQSGCRTNQKKEVAEGRGQIEDGDVKNT